MPAKPSPFLGMDPYIEPVWRPFHHDYLAHLKDQLRVQLPGDLYAAMESDVFVVEGNVRGQLLTPDAAAFEAARGVPDDIRTNDNRGMATLTRPIRARVSRRPELLPQVAIREPRRGNRLITAVELFSPTNKDTARERATYRDQRDAYLRGGANVVEVDLLRGGRNMMDLVADDLPDEAGVTYRVCVRFASPELGDSAEYYPIRLRESLPRVAVPLRPADDDVVLDLQRALDDVYVGGRYDLQLDYDRPPVPPLSPADAAWAAERVAGAERNRV